MSIACRLPRQVLEPATGLGLIALAHFVDEFDGLLQQRHLGAHRVEQAVPARWLLAGCDLSAARLSLIA